MKRYQVSIRKKAFKKLKKLEKRIGVIVDRRIDSLAEEPRPEGCKKLVGFENTYRIRVGSIRIAYRVIDKEVMVIVLSIEHRKDIYRVFNR